MRCLKELRHLRTQKEFMFLEIQSQVTALEGGCGGYSHDWHKASHVASACHFLTITHLHQVCMMGQPGAKLRGTQGWWSPTIRGEQRDRTRVRVSPLLE